MVAVIGDSSLPVRNLLWHGIGFRRSDALSHKWSVAPLSTMGTSEDVFVTSEDVFVAVTKPIPSSSSTVV